MSMGSLSEPGLVVSGVEEHRCRIHDFGVYMCMYYMCAITVLGTLCECRGKGVLNPCCSSVGEGRS